LRSRTGYDAIAERIAKFSEVVSVRLISGDHDLSLTVRGKSMKDVAFFVAEKIATLEQVQGTVTHFVLRTYKQDGDILFEKERSERPPGVSIVRFYVWKIHSNKCKEYSSLRDQEIL